MLRPMNKKQKAFTLIELLTVMAISAILLTIIAIPVIQSFNLTRAAQGFSDAQNRARLLVERIEREISNAAAIRDNTGTKGVLAVQVPGDNGALVYVELPYSKIDIVKPASGDPASRVGTAYIDPDTGKVDPTLRRAKGQPNLPAAPGDMVVRYFIARRDPFSNYVNPWVQYNNTGGNKWLGNAAGRDNLYVLYRAEVQPYVYYNDGSGPQRVVNSAFFWDLDRDADPNTAGPLMDDPYFFEPGAGPSVVYGVARTIDADKSQMIRNWMSVASVVTEISRYDMIMPLINKRTNDVLFTGNVPRLVSLARFQPTRVALETATAEKSVRIGEEVDNGEKIGPSVFRTQYGNLANFSARIWPSLVPGPYSFGDASSGAKRIAWQPGAPFLDVLTSTTGDLVEFNGANGLFNISGYKRDIAGGVAYPFTRNTSAAASIAPDNAFFIPVVPDDRGGFVNASFSIQEVGIDGAVALDDRIPSNNNVTPGIAVGAEVTPADPTYTVAPTWTSYNGINERFARLWHEWDGFWPNPALIPPKEGPNGVKRFIDLRQMAQFGPSNHPSPLAPGRFRRASIVPGSEEIYGPDQTPGPNYGRLVRYTRVSNVDSVVVGINQYKINYVDRKEPDWSFFGFGGMNYDPAFYNGADFLSAALQAKYRGGYVEFNSKFGEPIPAGNIYVTYRFQMTEPNDYLAVDYDSGELMEIALTIRNYPQTTIPNPQMTTVRGSSAVRNLIR